MKTQKQRQEERERIRAAVSAFKESGGKIYKAQPGESSSKNLGFHRDYAAVHEAKARKSKRGT